MSFVVDGINDIVNRRIREVLQDLVRQHPQLNYEELETKYCIQCYSPTKNKGKKNKAKIKITK